MGSLRGNTGGSTVSARWWECEGRRGGSCQEAERGASSPTPRAERREQTLGQNGNRESETGSDTTNMLTKHGHRKSAQLSADGREHAPHPPLLAGLAGLRGLGEREDRGARWQVGDRSLWVSEACRVSSAPRFIAVFAGLGELEGAF